LNPPHISVFIAITILIYHTIFLPKSFKFTKIIHVSTLNPKIDGVCLWQCVWHGARMLCSSESAAECVVCALNRTHLTRVKQVAAAAASKIMMLRWPRADDEHLFSRAPLINLLFKGAAGCI
jgi:hypothetical protein